MNGEDGERRKVPAHARGRSLSKSSEDRLTELGNQVPPPTGAELAITKSLRRSRRRKRALSWAVFLIVALLLAGAITQWVRPLPDATVHTAALRVPGAAPSLAWPSTGQAAVFVEGVGSLGQHGGSQPVPIAGLATLLTAYVVMTDHPLSVEDDGPSIPITADTLTSYHSGLADQVSEVPITAGESLSELEALEGMLIDSGADMATLLADWDAGSVPAFVTKMNLAAQKLGMLDTHITDPSGVDPGTTSTAADLIRLGQAALKNTVLAQIVSLGQPSVPNPPVPAAYNLNFDLGQDGIIGLISGSDSSAGGCFLFAAQQSVGAKQVTIVGAVLGQPGGSLGPNTAAVDAGDALVKSVNASLQSVTVLSPGQKAGELSAPWGSTAAITVTQPVTVIGWPGLSVPVATYIPTLKGGEPSGASVGLLQVGNGAGGSVVGLHTSTAFSGPGLWWRLTR